MVIQDEWIVDKGVKNRTFLIVSFFVSTCPVTVIFRFPLMCKIAFIVKKSARDHYSRENGVRKESFSIL